jgi:hypothetical protein
LVPQAPRFFYRLQAELLAQQHCFASNGVIKGQAGEAFQPGLYHFRSVLGGTEGYQSPCFFWHAIPRQCPFFW